MMFPPFYRYPYYRNYHPYYNSYYNNLRPNVKNFDDVKHEAKPIKEIKKETSSFKETSSDKRINDEPLFEIMGIKLYFDDILILCLIFFLYQEGTDDSFLMIALVLLLMS